MGLWVKGLRRNNTQDLRLEDSSVFHWMDEICMEINARQIGVWCNYEHQVTPFGHMMFIRFGDSYMSFNISMGMSKIHILSQIKYGLENLIMKAPNQEVRSRLEHVSYILTTLEI